MAKLADNPCDNRPFLLWNILPSLDEQPMDQNVALTALHNHLENWLNVAQIVTVLLREFFMRASC